MQVSLKSDKNKRVFDKKINIVYIYDHISLNSSYNGKYFGQKL